MASDPELQELICVRLGQRGMQVEGVSPFAIQLALGLGHVPKRRFNRALRSMAHRADPPVIWKVSMWGSPCTLMLRRDHHGKVY